MVARPRAQATRTSQLNLFIVNTKVIELYNVKNVEGLDDELNLRLLQLPYGGAIFSGDKQPILKPLVIDFAASQVQVVVTQAGLELSANAVSSQNTLQWLLRQITRLTFRGKKINNIQYLSAGGGLTGLNSSSDFTVTFLPSENHVTDPVEWISPETLDTATIEIEYSYQLLAESSLGIVTYTLLTPRTGLSVTSAGLLEWIEPDIINELQISVRAIDINGNSSDRVFIIPTEGNLYPAFYPGGDMYPFY